MMEWAGDQRAHSWGDNHISIIQHYAWSSERKKYVQVCRGGSTGESSRTSGNSVNKVIGQPYSRLMLLDFIM